MHQSAHLPPDNRRSSRNPGPIARLVVIVSLACIVATAAVVWAEPGAKTTGASNALVDQPEFSVLESVWALIGERYADPDAIDAQNLLYGAASGMVEALGDTGHSAFLEPEEAKAYRAALSGELIGLGISIDYVNGEPVIVTPIEDSPAQRAGLQAGDIIVEIDGVSTLRLTDAEVSDLLRGEEGTPVHLTIDRADAPDLLEIRVVRGRIELDPVTWSVLPNGIGIVQLHEFSDGSGQALRTALLDLAAAGAVEGIVLDLRNNPGGYVHEAITVASQFLPEGTTIYRKQERGAAEEAVASIGNDGAALDVPLVVLVNRASASASEMVAAALRDSGRAQIVGERTFGTGTIVTTIGMDDGAALALGTALWTTPDGDVVWKVGLEPDVEVRQRASDQPIELEDGKSVTGGQLVASSDTQLFAALDVLTGADQVAA